MTAKTHLNGRIYLTLAATVYIACLLTWEHFNGGVVSHNILHREDLPAISNWWGLVLLPALTWFLSGRVQKREADMTSKAVVIPFVASILYGISISVSFLNSIEPLASLMGPGILVLALFVPVFRAEYVLGFVISMTFTFGALLPTAFAAVVGLLAFVIYRFIRPIPIKLLRKF